MLYYSLEKENYIRFKIFDVIELNNGNKATILERIENTQIN